MQPGHGANRLDRGDNHSAKRNAELSEICLNSNVSVIRSFLVVVSGNEALGGYVEEYTEASR